LSAINARFRHNTGETFDEHSNKNGYRLPEAACTCPNRMVVFIMGGYIKNISASGL